MRSLLFLSPHFPPDSSAGTHRARILAPHLARFGWRPTVLTVDPQGVEGEVDPELAAAMADELDVVRVNAWPHALTRRLGFGDLGLRAYRPLRQAALDLVRHHRIDATLVTTYPTYPALIAARLKRQFGVPYVLDLQDPWVGAWGKDVGPGGRPDLRSRASRAVATRLEVIAAGSADALVSVTRRTMQDVVTRVPAASGLPQLEMPIGWEPRDWQRIRADGAPNVLFDTADGLTHVCAVGTLLPAAVDGLARFLEGVSRVVEQPAMRSRLKIWFVGTSNQRRHEAPSRVDPLVHRAGLCDVVMEHAPRLAYFEALRVLRDSHAVLVLGSDEPHYTPSRLFPAIASRRPIIARLHPESPASHLLAVTARSRSVAVIPANGNAAGEIDAFAHALRDVLTAPRAGDGDDAMLSPFTGEALARQVAALLDRICQ